MYLFLYFLFIFFFYLFINVYWGRSITLRIIDRGKWRSFTSYEPRFIYPTVEEENGRGRGDVQSIATVWHPHIRPHITRIGNQILLFFFFYISCLFLLSFLSPSAWWPILFPPTHFFFFYSVTAVCIIDHWKEMEPRKLKKTKGDFLVCFLFFFLVICRRKTWKESAHAHLRLNISWRKELSWETTGLVRFPCNFISFLTAVTVPFLQVFDSSFSWSFLFIVELSWLFDFGSFHSFAMKWTNGMVSNDKR